VAGIRKAEPPVQEEELPLLLRTPNLIATVQGNIKGVGVVGEEDNALLTWLAYCSRVLKKPDHVLPRGSCNMGKSELLERVADLLPTEVKIEAMETTTAAWFNTPEDYWRHKVFLAGEKKHSTDPSARDAGAMLRQMISQGRVNRLVSVYDPATKGWVSKPIQREGPIAYAGSSTSEDVFPDDQSRVLQLYVDESEEQDRRVIEAIGDSYDPDADPEPTETIIERHHKFQQWLQRQKIPRVGVPYQKILSRLLPTGSVSRRLAKQVYVVIEILAVVQQHRRARHHSDPDCILATLEDYAVARRLLLPPAHAALGAGKGYAKAQKLRKALAGIGVTGEFTQRDVRKAMGYQSDQGPSKLVATLEADDCIKVVAIKLGSKPARYDGSDKVINSGMEQLLPDVEALRSQMVDGAH
jgi:hypothetical protein